ncbi:MAG: DUF1015 family protein [Micromonosporaceae bacterium]|nr:DUF1015 family protein [Micromonosporaceae bacterium]
MTVAHPIARAWFSTGGEAGTTTGAQNYDEFASDAEITAIIASNPASALAIEMPHRAPDCVGRPFLHCLPEAVSRLAEAKAAGRYAPADEVVAVYRTTAGTSSGYGLWCMIDTAEISATAEEPGSVIRNEDVFLSKVRERVALAEVTGHLLSPVLLLQTADSDALHEALAEAAAAAGPATLADVDQAGRVHEVWAIGPGTTTTKLLRLAGAGELVVADGNHRSLAAQTAGLRRFLAVVTTARSVAIDPYNRLVTELPMTVDAMVETLRARGATVEAITGRPDQPVSRGTIHCYTRAGGLAVILPTDDQSDPVDNLDHALVERHLLRDGLGLDPGDKRIIYVGGDYPAEWLCDEVDADRAELAIFIAPVTVADFVSVNLARRKMPRKSTWFTPKARAGLVIADLSVEDGNPRT